MQNHFPLGTTHFAPETRCAIHSSRGRSPFDVSPNSLTPSAHWTGSPTIRFFSRMTGRKPAAAICRAAMPPEGPAPTTTASYTRCREEVAAISALRGRLGGEPRRELVAVGRRPVDVRRHAPSDCRAALLRDEPDGGEDPKAIHGRVFGQAEFLADLRRARIRMVADEPEDRERVPVQRLRGLLLLRSRLERQPLVYPLPLLRRRDDDVQQCGLLDFEEVFRDRGWRDPHHGRQLRDL